jgi:hypothetical protein
LHWGLDQSLDLTLPAVVDLHDPASGEVNPSTWTADSALGCFRTGQRRSSVVVGSPAAAQQPQVSVSMGAFIAFVDAPGKKRSSLVVEMEEEYNPARDPYRLMRGAIKSGRRMSKDQLAMDAAIASCPRPMKQHYREIADGWLQYVAGCSNDTITDLSTGRWRAHHLAVRVTPDLAVRRADGSYDAIKLYLRADPPTNKHVGAVLWLLRQAMPQCLPGARAVLLDVRRVTPYTQLSASTDFAAWLDKEAASFAYLKGHPAA